MEWNNVKNKTIYRSIRWYKKSEIIVKLSNIFSKTPDGCNVKYYSAELLGLSVLSHRIGFINMNSNGSDNEETSWWKNDEDITIH